MSHQRVTIEDVRSMAARVSACFTSELRVEVEGRYGYTALDLYDRDGCVRTIATGMTKREARTYLEAMYEALDITNRT